MRRFGVITLATGATLILALCLAACDVDLFGNDRQPLVGPYGVFVGEGKYYLVLDRFQAGCGLLGAAIHQIGWNERVILVQLEPCVGDGPPSGWRVVNVQAKTIETISEGLIKPRPDLTDLKLVPAAEAWSRGRSRRK